MEFAWLRGPIEGIDPLLAPAAHALVQTDEDIAAAVEGLTPAQVWMQPGGAASIGFHMRHVIGSVDRMLTYAKGKGLDMHQRAFLEMENEPDDPPTGPEPLVAGVHAAVQSALRAYAHTPREALLEPRTVGRKALPTTVIGLLFHAAEHAQRHAGQIATTAKIIRGLKLGDDGSGR